VPNSVYKLAVAGSEKRTTTKMTSDFILEQDLHILVIIVPWYGTLSIRSK